MTGSLSALISIFRRSVSSVASRESHGVSTERYRECFEGVGLSSWAFYVLAALARSGAPYQLSPTDLYQSLLVSSGVMTNRIARLERAELVKRIPDPSDGRGVIVALTPKGRSVVNTALEHHNANEQRLLEALSLGERETLSTSLRKLLIAAGDRPHAARHAPLRSTGDDRSNSR